MTVENGEGEGRAVFVVGLVVGAVWRRVYSGDLRVGQRGIGGRGLSMGVVTWSGGTFTTSTRHSPSVPTRAVPPTCPTPSPRKGGPFAHAYYDISLSLIVHASTRMQISAPVVITSFIGGPQLCFPGD